MGMYSTSVRRFVLFFALLSLFGLEIGQAQTGTTSLRGIVTDQTGGAIAGATVTIKNVSLDTQRSATSSSTGQYEFLGLTPGTYELTVEKPNFQRYLQANLELLVNLPATQDVILSVGSNTQTVEVSAQTETLNTTDASLGTTFDENRIRQLPIESRNVAELLSLQAGVAYTGNRLTLQEQDTDTRNGAVNGARSDQSNITLDGVDVNSDTKGYAFDSVLPITADSVQEFRVTTTNYNADEGRSSGAQVVLVTKSGTNSFHGSIYEYNRNAATSANDYFLKLAQLESGEPNKAEALVRNNFGASLGGPILKDRLFFFANYEGERQADQQSVVRVVPSAALRDGVITYVCDDPTQCPGGTVQGLSSSHTIAAGNYALGPTQLKAMDPQGIGVNTSVMIPYFNSFPMPNDNSVGDGYNFQGYRFAAPNLITDNWYIARVDYKITKNGNHSLFWRGALRNDSNLESPYLPTKSSFYPSGPGFLED
jgi:Carboxypeptidase regulatory-like domain